MNSIYHYYSNGKSLPIIAATVITLSSAYAYAGPMNDYGENTPTPLTAGQSYYDSHIFPPDYQASENFITPYLRGAGREIWTNYFFLEGPLQSITTDKITYGSNTVNGGQREVFLNILYIGNEVFGGYAGNNTAPWSSGRDSLDFYFGNLIQNDNNSGSTYQALIENIGELASTVLYKNYAQGAHIINSDFGSFYIDRNTVVDVLIQNTSSGYMFIDGNYAENAIIENTSGGHMTITGNQVNNVEIINGSATDSITSSLSILIIQHLIHL